ncbi:hypothetical protein FOCC_FOCC012189 [Frankliniella occidentalis]|nr:hypothetical protein FOCC_FOCC012189 [Frankliniella occidentalis]
MCCSPGARCRHPGGGGGAQGRPLAGQQRAKVRGAAAQRDGARGPRGHPRVRSGQPVHVSGE